MCRLIIAALIVGNSLTLTWAQSFVWARHLDGDTGTDNVVNLAVNWNQDVHAVGTFHGTVDFDPGPGIVDLTAATFGDGFVWKLGKCGELSWARQFDPSLCG